LGPGRHAVPPPPWPDAPRLVGVLDVRKPQQVAPVVPQVGEPVVRKPQQAAPAAGLLREERSDATAVSQRRRVVG
jgi:hypothetical protein